jgi:hypothetical protein
MIDILALEAKKRMLESEISSLEMRKRSLLSRLDDISLQTPTSDLLALEAKKRVVKNEVDSLELKKSNFRRKMTEDVQDEADLMVSLSELEREREGKLAQVKKVKLDLANLGEWYRNQRKIYNQTLGKEVDELLNEISKLEEMYLHKQISYREYEAGLHETEKLLWEKELELEHKDKELGEKEERARKEQFRAGEMMTNLEFWGNELREKSVSLKGKCRLLKSKEKAVDLESSRLEIEIKDFKGKSGDWVRKFEAKQKLVSGLQIIFEQRERSMKEMFEYFEREKIWLRDQRKALDLAWAELNKLKENF